MFDPRPADYFDPPALVCRAMRTVDLNILLASTGMLHSSANLAAMEAGVPTICMDGGLTLEMFQSGAVTADYHEIAVCRHYVAANVFGPEAKSVRVTSRLGTDITYDVTDRIFVPPLRDGTEDPYRIYRETDENRPQSSLYYFLFPTGEFNIPPVEGSANGTIVFDLTMHHLGRLLTPIICTVRDSRIIAIDGDADARALRDYLTDYGDENAYYCPAEASIGINREARIRGIQREDKNIFGSIHFGLGTNVDVGGSIRSKIHLDGVVLQPSVYVDGELRMEYGTFLVPVDRPLEADTVVA
jgi:leucyl aminopeptidase (aminopeptidase T)